MTSELFNEWLENCFIPYVSQLRLETNLPLQTGLLLLDGHCSHETLSALELASQHNIVIFCLPLHMTHMLQPLDVAFFKSLKSNWDRECESYARDPRNNGEFVKKATFCRVFERVWIKSCSVTTISNGFRKCGLHPYRKLSLADQRDNQEAPSTVLHRENELLVSTVPDSGSNQASPTVVSRRDYQASLSPKLFVDDQPSTAVTVLQRESGTDQALRGSNSTAFHTDSEVIPSAQDDIDSLLMELRNCELPDLNFNEQDAISNFETSMDVNQAILPLSFNQESCHHYHPHLSAPANRQQPTGSVRELTFAEEFGLSDDAHILTQSVTSICEVSLSS